MATKAERKVWRAELQKKLAAERQEWRDKLADVRGKQRASSPGASQTAIKKSAADDPNVDTPRQGGGMFGLLKLGVVVGGIGAGIWYYYHSGPGAK